MKFISLAVLALAVAFAGCGGCNRTTEGPVKEISSESIEKVGDTWNVNFTSKFDAPVDKVWEAMTQPERMHEMMPDNILKSELVSKDGDSKVVDLVFKLDILPPGFKVQTIRNQLQFFPNDKRIEQKSVDFKLADIASEYKLTPINDGKGTLLTFKQTSKDKSPLLVDSLQKGALRETYIRQVDIVNKALGVNQQPAAQPAG
jgi:hypothetical protein